MNENMVAYYQQRANEYEHIYHKPERQLDIAKATELLQQLFSNKEVLEVACGTGFWTERIAKMARSIMATDINQTVLAIAKTKQYSPATVAFNQADLFNLKHTKTFQSLFGGFYLESYQIAGLALVY